MLHSRWQRGFTLIELMVVLAMIGALSVVFLMDIGTTMGKTHSVQHVRDIHALGRAALKLEDALKATANAITGGNMVIQGAFPHGGITQSGNSFTPAIGSALTVSWNQSSATLSMINTAVAQPDCVELLKSIDAAMFSRIVVTQGATTHILTRSNWPITLAVAANNCPNTPSTITFEMKP